MPHPSFATIANPVIIFRTVSGYRRPVVASRCNGFGYCEDRCPVHGESTIVVIPIGEIR